MSSIIPNSGCLTIILSAELDGNTSGHNRDCHIDLRERLAHQFALGELYSVQECRGSYKGIPERSIAITGSPVTVLAIGQHHGDLFHQESILVINDHGGGCLRYIDRPFSGDDDPIGHYTELEDSGAADAWTRVLATGHLFTFR